MFARPIHYLNRYFRYLITLHPQKYVNAMLVLIGLSADLIALGTFFGAIHTPETGSNREGSSFDIVAGKRYFVFGVVTLGEPS